MEDDFLEKYFEKLSAEIDNQEFIDELKSKIEKSNKQSIEELIKKYY